MWNECSEANQDQVKGSAVSAHTRLARIVQLYREGTIAKGVLFVGLAKHAQRDDWKEAISLLKAAEQEEFFAWARELASGKVIIIQSAGLPSEAEIEALRDRLREQQP